MGHSEKLGPGQGPSGAGATSVPSVGPGKQTLVGRLEATHVGQTSRSPAPYSHGNVVGSSTTRAAPVQDEALLLAHQARLASTDVEIPALEGALLATRKLAVERNLLSQESFAAGLALSRAMARLQPAIAADAAVEPMAQEQAAIAAQQLFYALRRETSDMVNFRALPSMDGDSGNTANPYTQEVRVTTGFLFWASTHDIGSWFERLPGLIRQSKWRDAVPGYRRMLEGLDLWVSDQLRKSGKGTPDEALGHAQQHHAQLRSALEVIADKHGTRIPALFRPDAKTVAAERAAGHAVVDAVPMNVYFWKDAKSGKLHLCDLTTPSRPHEHIVDGPLTATTLHTFFEEVARYPEGEVRYELPGGGAGTAATTGKTKWYEWVGYAGLAIAAVGLALVTAGASIPATACFALGAAAGGASAVGHLVDSAVLGTATTTTVVLDVAQAVAAFASVGALSITWRAGSAAAALANSRWFVPLVSSAATADAVQLVALTDVTFVELTKLQNGPGSPEDKQRAMAVLVTQLAVAGGLTALSVRGVRNVRALSGKPLEVVELQGVHVLRVVGDEPPMTALRAAGPEASTAGAGFDAESNGKVRSATHHDINTAPHAGESAPRSPARDVPKSWDKFSRAGDESFKARLKDFRGNDNLVAEYSGGEGRVFMAQDKHVALKRWFQARLSDMPASLTKLRDARADIEAHPKLASDIEVVKIYEEGPDWILRDFDPNSLELKSGPTEAQAARSRAIAELDALQARGRLSAMLADLLRKLKKQPPSANLHWSPTKQKILVIDMQ